MKKMLIITNFLFAGIILFQACNSSKSKPEPVVFDANTTKANECTPKSLINYNDETDDGSLDAFLAKRMSENYADDPAKGFIYNGSGILGEGAKGNKEDTKSVWLDLGKLKNLVSTIENSVCEKECKTPLKLGVRIYFGLYSRVTGSNSPDEDLRNLPPTYAKRHTIFLVGTYDNAKGNHVDFDPMNVEDKCQPTPFAVLMQNRDKKYKVNSLRKPRNIAALLGDSTALNHGDLMPPPEGKGTFPTNEY